MALAPSMFLHLKYWVFSIHGAYNYFSLVSFLAASPTLETLTLSIYWSGYHPSMNCFFVTTHLQGTCQDTCMTSSTREWTSLGLLVPEMRSHHGADGYAQKF
uniref:At1g61320/AtMIF1 LRR domain-containing protein n=1 Tax=Triticum urartu TaxID=4572 RepID=A0A8R7QH71_TRIUA